MSTSTAIDRYYSHIASCHCWNCRIGKFYPPTVYRPQMHRSVPRKQCIHHRGGAQPSLHLFEEPIGIYQDVSPDRRFEYVAHKLSDIMQRTSHYRYCCGRVNSSYYRRSSPVLPRLKSD